MHTLWGSATDRGRIRSLNEDALLACPPVFLVADGRRDGWSEKGMTLQEMQQVFVEEGALVAYNLDGGGSATLVFEGTRLNQASGARERPVSDIVYITK